jgi:hypothetical protein
LDHCEVNGHCSPAKINLSLPFGLKQAGISGVEIGSVPLPVVTARIDRLIAENGKGPYPDME